MTIPTFIAALAIGAAAIALWAEVRFPKLGPDRVVGALLHLLAATVAAQLVVPAALDAVANKILAVFLIALPTLIYIFLTAIWIMKLARNAMGGAYR